MSGTKLAVTAKPSQTRHVLIRSDSKNTTILLKGKGDQDFLCGQCNAVLVESAKQGQFQAVIFLCNSCGAYNEMAEGKGK